jgi:aminoglycoside phosphotransferase (APT) family kinase protein
VVAAVLDWEFAFSGSPLLDVGHFLRYERAAQPLREPQFSRGFVEHGGKLPEDWRHVVRVIDLTALADVVQEVKTETSKWIKTKGPEFRWGGSERLRCKMWPL